jgi:hypothetical protein
MWCEVLRPCLNGIHEVGGSIPPGSTKFLKNLDGNFEEPSSQEYRLGSLWEDKLTSHGERRSLTGPQ